jgi:hypothetical protein
VQPTKPQQLAPLQTAPPPKDARTSLALGQGGSTATIRSDDKHVGKDVSKYVVTSAETPQAAPPIHSIKAYQTSDALEVQPTEPQYRMKVSKTVIASRSLDTLASHAVH